MSEPLCIESVTKTFGGFTALENINMTLKKGEILGLIGPNGAGKTTLFNVITGVYKPDNGRIFLEEKDITGLKPHTIAKKGIARSFQINSFVTDFTVFENLLIGSMRESGLKHYTKESEAVKRAEDIMSELWLDEYRDTISGSLPYGAQRFLEVGTALANDSSIYLLDEPTSGMEKDKALSLMEKVTDIGGEEKSFIIIEHNLELLFDFVDKVVCLHHGSILEKGEPEEVSKNETVQEAYLGGSSCGVVES